MPGGLGIDLNQEPPEAGLDHSDWDGPAHGLDYGMVWDGGTEGDLLIVMTDMAMNFF